jgi:hypothetical protein
MPSKRSMLPAALTALTLIALFTVPFTQSVQAQTQTPPALETRDNCMNCHENLYFLHDTGNWYCLREAPMTCTQCHGGNPSALTQEEAHTGRAAHPVINEDISKCQECHPEKCYERVELFSQVAGIDEVLVAAPYTPFPLVEESAAVPFQDRQEHQTTWINLLEILPIVLVAGAALIIYGLYALRHGG